MGSRWRLLWICLVLPSAGCLGEFDELFSAKSVPNSKRPYVIVFLIDGYRHDYTQTLKPPTLLEIEKTGAVAESLIPVYPSDTFPGLYSLATGMYSENHGIVGNRFYDAERKEQYYKNDKTPRDGSWYGGTPFWVAAEKQGVLTATLFWTGSEAAIQDQRPSYFYYFDDSVTNQARVDQVVTWLSLPPERRPHLISVYFSTVDLAGHRFNSKSPEVIAAVMEVDRQLARLMRQVRALGIRANYVILSTQGMQDLSEKKVEYLEDFVNINSLHILGDIPRWSIYFDDKAEFDKFYLELKLKARHFQVYKREEIPKRLHYSKTRRVGEIVIIADSPYSIRLSRESQKITGRVRFDSGGHGFDPYENSTMHGIFYAIGPGFKPRVKIPSFENIHVYPLLLSLLGLKIPSNTDGDLQVLAHILESTNAP